jgi:DNA-binding NarL/FixJ family response regulator
MNIPVAVADPVPSYRYGVVAALVDAGFDAEGTENPESWVKAPGRRALLVSATLPEEAPRLSALITDSDDVVIVALLRDVTPAAYVEALRQGASGAVAWDAAPGTMIEVLQGAMEGQCILPLDVARLLAASQDFSPELPALSDWEMTALRLLANGVTIAELANETNHSERETFRLLHRLYERMGAASRSEAIVRAAQIGLLDTVPDESFPTEESA